MQGYFSADAVSCHCSAVSERKADVMLNYRVPWGHKGGSQSVPPLSPRY